MRNYDGSTIRSLMQIVEKIDPFAGEKPIWQQNSDRKLSEAFILRQERRSGCMDQCAGIDMIPEE